MAVDTAIRKVYHGNCIDSNTTSKTPNFDKMVTFHEYYAKFLLQGMINGISRK